MVLAADEPLSLQAHPSAEQAVEGFTREDRLKIPVTAPTRNYRDRSHNRSSSWHSAGSRPSPDSGPQHAAVELMRALAVSDLELVHRPAVRNSPEADGLRALFTTWITAPQPDLDVLVPAVLDGARELSPFGRNEIRSRSKTVLELGERYPGDAGVLASLLLNRITLEPGGASTCPPEICTPTARGGLEVMANSDNRIAWWVDAQARSTCPKCGCGCWTFNPDG